MQRAQTSVEMIDTSATPVQLDSKEREDESLRRSISYACACTHLKQCSKHKRANVEAQRRTRTRLIHLAQDTHATSSHT